MVEVVGFLVESHQNDFFDLGLGKKISHGADGDVGGVDGAVDSPADQQSLVGGVDYSVYFQLGNVPQMYLDFVVWVVVVVMVGMIGHQDNFTTFACVWDLKHCKSLFWKTRFGELWKIKCPAYIRHLCRERRL